MQLEHKYNEHGALNCSHYDTTLDSKHEESIHHAFHQLQEDDV